ncbi:MAG: zinc ribbon domain-containing protein, partial [Muribaculaceae bacterium]|nr:zinc ribbon domain-containing protein [Muribaculaceae bacterium]
VPDGSAYCPVCQSPMSQGLPKACPNCGYPPANPNSTICPYCHSPLPAGQQPAQSDAWSGSQNLWEPDGRIDIFGDSEQPAEQKPEQEQPQPQQSASVPAWQHDTPEPPTEPAAPEASFELRPMISPLMPASMQGIAMQGESVVLNGQNMPGPMMDPECQAVVTRDADGNWTIADGSQNKSTYMLVNRPMVLRDGDVIILGGNLYVFHPNEQL